ncbi:MAG: DUF58 domain-containing protein [Acidimicrobiales bacterium]
MPRATPRLVAYTAIAAYGLLAAVALHRPEPALLALPFAAVLLVALVGGGPLEPRVSLSVDADTVMVGDLIEVTVRIETRHAVPWFEIGLVVPPGLSLESWTGVDASPGATAVVLRLLAGEPTEVRATLRCGRWGAYRPGRVRVVAADRFRVFQNEMVITSAAIVRVHPPTAKLRRLAEPRWLQGLAGAHRSRERADGIEYAETRPWAPGDRLRAVNWRVSARLGEWFVSDRHPERSADVVLLLDSFTDVGLDLDTTLGMAVEAMVTLAEGHLGVQDRVGLLGYGGFLDWVVPDLGPRQLHRIVDAVLDTQVVTSLADRSVAIVPSQALPPRALVVALSPLVDPRAAGVLARVRARGCDLVVIDVSPVPFLPAPTTEAEALARRAWELERDVLRHGLRRVGSTVVTWERGTPFAAVLSESVAWRARPEAARRAVAR